MENKLSSSVCPSRSHSVAFICLVDTLSLSPMQAAALSISVRTAALSLVTGVRGFQNVDLFFFLPCLFEFSPQRLRTAFKRNPSHGIVTCMSCHGFVASVFLASLQAAPCSLDFHPTLSLHRNLHTPFPSEEIAGFVLPLLKLSMALSS